VRVLHVIQEFAPGGAERVAVSVAKATAANGGQVGAVAAGGPLAEEFPGPISPLPLVEQRPWRLPAAARAVARARRSLRPDVVHAHNPGAGAATALATRRGRSTPAVVTVQGVPDEDYARTARILRLAGLPVVACGPGVADGLAEHGLHVVATIPNSVSPAPPPADRAALAAEWDLPPGPLLVAVGRLVPQKNHSLALRALAKVPGPTLVIVGEGPLRRDLEEEAAALGIADRVRLPGVRADARAIMAAADAVVLPSVWEGLPLAGLEALAAGTPLVTTSVRGIRESLVDGRTALLVPADDPDALAAALTRVLGDEALAAALRRAGLQEASLYTEDAMVEAYGRLYEEIAR
jgi:glycosyltransferase involved in cell wall biosynthesis